MNPTHRAPHTTLALLAALSVAACDGAATPDAATPVDAATDAAADRATVTDGAGGDVSVGAFQVRLVAPSDAGAGYTSVVGKVQDGQTPAQIVWETRATDGDCTLLVPRVPFCATPCGGTSVCVENDTCRPYPTAQSVGTVSVHGVRTAAGATAYDMTYVAGAYQTPGSVMLPYPAFAEGDAIRIDAAGSAFASAFTLSARGIAPLALTGSTVRLQSGQALDLAWTAPTQTGSRVQVHLDISHHGGTRGKVECDTADDGAMTLSASLVTQLLALGVAGYPSIVVTRVTTGTAAIPAGRVDLSVTSDIETAVEIPNLRSCTSSADCDGGTCRADLTCG